MASLEDFTRNAVRQMSTGEAPIRDTPTDGPEGRHDPYLGFERPQPQPADLDLVEAEVEPEEGEERFSDGSELGDYIGDRVAMAGWGSRVPMVKAEDLATLEDEMAAQDAAEPLATSARGFVELAYEHADEIAAEFGLSPQEYLASFTGMSEAAWTEATGLPPEARPSFRDLGREGQLDSLANALERDTERLKARGGHFE